MSEVESRGSASSLTEGTPHPATNVVQFIACTDEAMPAQSTEPRFFKWPANHAEPATVPGGEQLLAQELQDSARQLIDALDLGLAHLLVVDRNPAHEGLIAEIEDIVHRIDREIRALAARPTAG